MLIKLGVSAWPAPYRFGLGMIYILYQDKVRIG